jgi:excisionase family DNA binding protein
MHSVPACAREGHGVHSLDYEIAYRWPGMSTNRQEMTPMSVAPPALITQQSAARLIGCTVETVRTFIAQGLLPGYRIGQRMIRVKRCDVEALMHPVPTTPVASGPPIPRTAVT